MTNQTTYGNLTAVSAAEYDDRGRAVSRTDALSNTVFTAYDSLGHTLSLSGATYPVTYGYDTAGRMTALATTRDGVELDTTLWLYDHFTGLLTNKVYADGSRVRYTYTQSGRPLRTTWARGTWKENAYDALGQFAATAYSGGTPDVTLARNSFGTITNVTDASGLVYRFAVNDRQAVTNETVISGASTNTLTRLLDAFDRPAGLLLGSGYSLFCGRDSESRISVVSNAVFTARYSYTNGYAAGCALTFSNGNTLARAVIRDPRRPSLLTGVTNLFNGAPISSFAYTYDIVRRVTNRNSDAFGYNGRSELTSALLGAADYGYAYDSIGNRVWSAENALTNSYTANSLNQYTAAGSASPTYDTDGNTRWDGRMWHTWDAENRLTRSEPGWAGATNGAVMTDNRYDNRHRRNSKTVRQLSGRGAGYPLDPGQAGTWDEIETREFIYDGWNMIRETVSHTNGVTDVFEYFWGPDLSGTLQGAGGVGGLLAVSMNGSFYFPIYDNNGNVTDYVDVYGNVRGHFEYDAFGNTVAMWGDLAHIFRFRFSTKYWDEETCSYYYGYRHYAPKLGCWLSRDPIEERGGFNLYGFLKNNSINKKGRDLERLIRIRSRLFDTSPWNQGGMYEN